MNTRQLKSLLLLGLACLFVGVGGCAKSRAEMLRDRSALVERKLEAERNQVLSGGQLANSMKGGRESAITHLQALRLSLSVVNVSITSVPLLLVSSNEREIGYSVLDEAIGTIDWNIPLYGSAGAGGAGSAARAFPSLFSPQTGLDFAAIRQRNAPPGIAR